jgi:hypothetical protein
VMALQFYQGLEPSVPGISSNRFIKKENREVDKTEAGPDPGQLV